MTKEVCDKDAKKKRKKDVAFNMTPFWMLRLWFRRAKLDTPTEYESFIKIILKVRRKTTERTAWGTRKILRQVILGLLLASHTPTRWYGRESHCPEARCSHSYHDRGTYILCNDLKKYREYILRSLTSLYSPYRDRLCGLVVRVSGYRYRGPGFDPGAIRFSE